MNDAELHARVGDLERLPLDAHPHVLEEVRERIESELDELRQRVPSAPREPEHFGGASRRR